MSSLPLVFNILISCLITLIFLYRCGNYRRQHPITTIAVFISWAFSVMFVFLLPLDISLVRIDKEFVFLRIGRNFAFKAAYRECEKTRSTAITSAIADTDQNKVRISSFFLSFEFMTNEIFVERINRRLVSKTVVLCR